MAPQGSGRSSWTLAIFGVAILVNLLLTVVVLDQVDRTRDEMRALTDELATKQDVAMLRPLGVNRILERRCTGCHTPRRFAATTIMEEPALLSTVERMSEHTGGAIPEGEYQQIAAALLVRRCTACHSETVVSRLLLFEEADRLPFLRQKISAPGSGFRSDQVEELQRAIRRLAGESW